MRVSLSALAPRICNASSGYFPPASYPSTRLCLWPYPFSREKSASRVACTVDSSRNSKQTFLNVLHVHYCGDFRVVFHGYSPRTRSRIFLAEMIIGIEIARTSHSRPSALAKHTSHHKADEIEERSCVYPKDIVGVGNSYRYLIDASNETLIRHTRDM